MDYVFHLPIPYTHHSAGFRALYKIADEVRKRNRRVFVRPITEVPTGPPGVVPGVSPFAPFPIVEDSSKRREIREAYHLYPDVFCFQPNPERVERFGYLLARPDQIKRLPGDGFNFTWIQEWAFGLPRLCVDVIEPDLFYLKARPGRGILYYGGKQSLPDSLPDDGRVIDHNWPRDRKTLADVLRGAELLVSADANTMVVTEATVCGTPVLLTPDAPEHRSALYGRLGVARNEHELDSAIREVHLAAGHYEKVRREIAGDVDRFVDTVEEWFA